MLSYHLKDSDSGMEVDLIDHGATVTRILTPDRRGLLADVLLGCPAPEDYLRPHPHFNCLVGRYANRISHSRFRLDSVLYELDANNLRIISTAANTSLGFERGAANQSIKACVLGSSVRMAKADTPAN